MAITTTLRYGKGQQFFDASGKILSGGCLFYFIAGGTTPQTVYLDSGASTPYVTGTVNGVPYIQLDSAGRLDYPIYLGQTYNYKEVLTDYTGAISGITGANTVSPWPWDNIPIAAAAGTVSTFTLPYNPLSTVTSSASPVTLTAGNAGNAYEVDTSGGNVQFLLPDATTVTKGAYYRFKKVSASNSITFTPTAQTIDGASSFVVAALNTAIMIESDGANWKIWSSYGFPGSFDLQEIAAPAAPSSGFLRAYAASNDILTVQGSGGVKQPLGTGLAGVTGLVITNDGTYPNTKVDVTISAGLCVNQYGMVLPIPAGTAYCLTSAIGVGGIDVSSTLTGTNGRDLYLYIVTNGSTPGILASLTGPSTGPSLANAAGYAYSCYIGAMKLDSSGNLFRTYQKGRRATYNSSARAIGNGTITYATYFPATSESAFIAVDAAANSSGYISDMNGITLATPTGSAGYHNGSLVSLPNTGGTTFTTVQSTGTATFSAYGWIDAVNAT